MSIDPASVPFTTALRPAAAPATKTGVARRFTSLRAIGALTLREMATRYGNSPGGFIWALLEPLGMIVIMAVAFSIMLRTPPLGNSFIMFYATGYLPFLAFTLLMGVTASAIQFSRPLLQYPAVSWLDAVAARVFLNTLTSTLVTTLLLSGLIIITQTRVILDFPPIVEAMTMAFLIGTGVGMLNCILFGLFPLWQRIWGIVTRPLLLASGVIFLYDDLPQTAQNILWYNPLIHLTGLMRTGFYPTYRPDYINITYVAICAVVPLFLGIVLMSRYHHDILNKK